jgi:hypothetical protein
MAEQNFSNHKRYDRSYHFFIAPLTITCLILSGIHLFKAAPENHYNAALIFLGFFLLLCIGGITEENFRHFILTGKPLNSQLRMSQIIALRFSSDDEFPTLAQKAISESLNATDIKKSILNWRADHKRV